MNKKSTSICLKIIEIILFVFAAISLFRGFSIFSSDLEDFSHQWRLLPIEIGYMIPTYWLFLIHLLIYPINEKKMHQTLFVNGIILIAVALIGIIITSVYMGTGTYYFGDQVFSVVFPLDIYLMYVLSGALGAYFIFFDKKQAKGNFEYISYKGNKTHKVFASIFRPLYVLFSLYFFGALLDAIFLGYLNAASAAYFFVYMLIIYSPLSLVYYELLIRNNGEINISFSKKIKLTIASINLGIAVILSFLCYIYFAINPYYIAENFQMWLPLDFMGSMQLFPYLITLPVLGYAIYFFIMVIKEK